ncbi:MAG: hypothetical protein EZS28_030125 [Streblomastix strix]|uniref:Ubiquitin-like domain-containing protein n=1 Tax=Streblomastix strix TaxID=222440 RepID=A0A5J4UV78_9EUKA|nr:MAG: hypothetical protein EZS28_030125 [Streblomastix strix]
MQDTSLRLEQPANDNDAEMIAFIPQIAIDLQSSDERLKISALQQLLIIVIKVPLCLEQLYQQDIISILKEFLVSDLQSELQDLSIGIFGLIDVRCNYHSKKNRAVSSVNALLQIILSSDEKLSHKGSDALCKLICVDEQIRKVLFKKRFVYLILESLSVQAPEEIKSSSQDQEEEITQDFIQAGLLAVTLKLAEDEDKLEDLSCLIPQLLQLKNNKVKDVNIKARNLLKIFSEAGINYSSSQKQIQDKDEMIRFLKEELEQKNEEQYILREENRNKTERINELERNIAEIKRNSDQIQFQILIPAESNPKIDEINTISSTKTEDQIFIINKIITTGIYRCQFRVNHGGSAFGVMKSGQVLPTGRRCDQDIAMYFTHKQYLWQNWKSTSGNEKYCDGSVVEIEVNMAMPRTATLFINGRQQPVNMTGLPNSVQFFFSTYWQYTSVTVLSLKCLYAPTTVKIHGAKEVEMKLSFILANGQTFKVEVNQTDTIAKVKQKIENQLGFVASNINLIFDQRILDDSSSLFEIGAV